MNAQTLTSRQTRFVGAYTSSVALFNATKSCRLAGYSEKSCRDTGYENLRKPHIRAAIEERLEAAFDANEITIEKVLCVSESRYGYSLVAGVSRPRQYQAYRSLHGDVADTLQGDLANLGQHLTRVHVYPVSLGLLSLAVSKSGQISIFRVQTRLLLVETTVRYPPESGHSDQIYERRLSAKSSLFRRPQSAGGTKEGRSVVAGWTVKRSVICEK